MAFGPVDGYVGIQATRNRFAALGSRPDISFEKEIVRLIGLYNYVGNVQVKSTALICDNQSAIKQQP